MTNTIDGGCKIGSARVSDCLCDVCQDTGIVSGVGDMQGNKIVVSTPCVYCNAATNARDIEIQDQEEQDASN